MNRIVILAHTIYQVRRFCQKNALRPKEVLFASSPHRLDGIINCVVIYLDGWRLHPESKKIDERVQLARHHGVEILEMFDDELISKKIRAKTTSQNYGF